MRGKTKNLLIGILVLVIVALLAYIIYVSNKPEKVVQNRGIEVLDQVRFDNYFDEKMLVLKVKNTSNKTFNNVKPLIIFKDSNNMPFHEGWATTIGYMEPGEVRYLEVYDSVDDYTSFDVGFFDNEDDRVYEDLRENISYTAEKSLEVDEEGMYHLDFNIKNKGDKDAVVLFQIAYYDGEKLLLENQFLTVVDAKGESDCYESYDVGYRDGTPFPDGYTYEVTLAEAIDYIEYEDEEEEEFDLDALIAEEKAEEYAQMMREEEAKQKEASSIDYDSLSNEEKIEHALFTVFKESYGSKFASAKVTVDKIYTSKEIENKPEIKSLNVGEDELAFEVTVDFEPAEGADPNIFLIPDGELNKTSGWINNAHRVGILTPSTGEEKYKVRNYGTGW